jgi:protein phosphatase
MLEAQETFDTGAVTHRGKVRDRNEDNFLTRPEVGIWAVADGMGGHDAGDLASRTIVEALRPIKSPKSAEDLLKQCADQIADANRCLRAISRERGDVIIGATVAVLLIWEWHYACIWAGDSRIYLVRGGEITQLSRDHTEVQELLSQGVITPNEARTWPRGNVITNAIGVSDEPLLDMNSGALQPGDAFLVCSDGLTQHVENAEILDCIRTSPAQDACDRLVELTLQRGGFDNVTVIAVRYLPVRVSAGGSEGPLDLWELPE